MRNFQKELDTLLSVLTEKPTLLLHACCAPCASYVLEYLSPYFDITVFYYNPNIDTYSEFVLREQEVKRLAEYFSTHYISSPWENQAFEQAVQGHETDREGGGRCSLCFDLRLEKTAELARRLKLDYFTTTLSISPLKNAELLNSLGERAGERFGVRHLPSDFKKKEGYKRSLQLSRELALYRQNYCGCKYSKGREINVSD